MKWDNIMLEWDNYFRSIQKWPLVKIEGIKERRKAVDNTLFKLFPDQIVTIYNQHAPIIDTYFYGSANIQLIIDTVYGQSSMQVSMDDNTVSFLDGVKTINFHLQLYKRKDQIIGNQSCIRNRIPYDGTDYIFTPLWASNVLPFYNMIYIYDGFGRNMESNVTRKYEYSPYNSIREICEGTIFAVYANKYSELFTKPHYIKHIDDVFDINHHDFTLVMRHLCTKDELKQLMTFMLKYREKQSRCTKKNIDKILDKARDRLVKILEKKDYPTKLNITDFKYEPSGVNYISNQAQCIKMSSLSDNIKWNLALKAFEVSKGANLECAWKQKQ